VTDSREEDEGPSKLSAGDVESPKVAAQTGGWVGRETASRKNNLDPGGGPTHGRRVVARGVRRAQIDDRMLIHALLMIAKDLEREEAAERKGEKES
jgi:hypothetical protein